MFDIQEELRKMPDKPGVYLMKDKKGKVIYVGKAVVLKNRVRQYFQSLSGQSSKVRAMVPLIEEFEYIVTDSELEALILECNLIKKYRPKFNVLLKDDKTYPYIKVTMNEEYPRVIMTRRIQKDGGKYFGPYTNVGAVKETIKILKKLFPMKTCNKVLPRDIGKERPCLNYYIYQCLGPCQGNVDKEEYRMVMKDICSFLAGRQDRIIKRLEEQMKAASENMEFEKAARIRDKINSIKHISEKQKVLSTSDVDQDAIAFAKDETDACIQVFFIRGGKLIGREHFIFEGMGDVEDSELIASFMKQFYSTAEFVPHEILIQTEIDEVELLQKWLSEKRGAKVNIRVPRKGDKYQLIEMVSENAQVALEQFKRRIKAEAETTGESLKELTEILGLEEVPRRIEAYDISNTGSSEMVASMVVFEDGIPNNKEYRRFRIKSQEGQNDYGSMQEVIYRRFRRAEKEKSLQTESGIIEMEKGFSKLPDVIFVDGGLGHLNAANEVLKDLGIYNIPVFGMVKDSKHRTRGLVTPDGEIELSENISVLRLVTSIQNEAHRFAIEYNKKLRKDRYKSSELDNIEGVGEKRRKALLKHFGSISRIKAAEVDELAAVEGISKSTAQKIYDYFH
ncbi:MAG TPA: excinuclease ABC subunit UvrC [Clostridiaceae bacterium]|nr:excinuclease ABC subunit UvrC [Clostridiaceae bacterium]